MWWNRFSVLPSAVLHLQSILQAAHVPGANNSQVLLLGSRVISWTMRHFSFKFSSKSSCSIIVVLNSSNISPKKHAQQKIAETKLFSDLSAAGIHVELARLLLDKWRWFVGTWTGRYIGARTLDQIMREWAGIVEEEEAAAAAEAATQAQAAAGKHRTAEDGENEPRILQVCCCSSM